MIDPKICCQSRGGFVFRGVPRISSARAFLQLLQRRDHFPRIQQIPFAVRSSESTKWFPGFSSKTLSEPRFTHSAESSFMISAFLFMYWFLVLVSRFPIEK